MIKIIQLLLAAVIALAAVPSQAIDINLNKVKKTVAHVIKELPKPTVTLKNVDIASISFTDIHFLFTVSIKNPYPININLDKVRCDFNLEKITVFSTQTAGGLKVPGRGASDAQLDVVLAFKNIMDAAKTYGQSDRVSLQLAGDIVVSLLLTTTALSCPPFWASRSVSWALATVTPSLMAW